MVKRPKNLQTPLEAIPPVIKAALTKGMTQDITLTFDTPRIAASFVMECNSYRKQLHNSKNPEHQKLALSMYKAKVTRPGSGSEVRIYPRSEDFGDAMAQLGEQTEPIKEVSVDMTRKEPDEPESPKKVDLDDFLSDLE